MTRNKLWLLAATCTLLFSGIRQAEAVPAYPYPIRYTQSDGTTITIRISGDEYNHRVLSEDGYTLISSAADNDYYFATLANDGSLTATTVKARPLSRLSAADKAKVQKLPKGLVSMVGTGLPKPMATMRAPQAMLLSSRVDGMNVPARIDKADTKMEGKLHSLVILADFSDIKFTISNPTDAFSRLLNEDGYSENGATGSAWNYYYDNSNGKFDPSFDVVGPFKVSNTAYHYAGESGIKNTQAFMKEVVLLAAEQGVDFSKYADESGIVRDIFVFYAGHNQAEGAQKTIWPHRSKFSWGKLGTVSVNGVEVDGYACSSEYRGAKGTEKAAIGTFCHEFGHVLGWPDFYNTESNDGAPSGPQKFALMGMGPYNNESRTPPSLSILERWMVGWAEPETFTESKSYELGSVYDNKGYLAPTGTPDDYFLFELRGTGQKGTKTVWDVAEYIGGTGLIVYHIDYTPSYTKHWYDSNSVNTSSGSKHEAMSLVRSKPLQGSEKPTNDATRILFTEGSLLPSNNINYKSWTTGSQPLILVNNIELQDKKVILDIERTGGPIINFKADVYEKDAIISWTDNNAQSWDLIWKMGNSIVGQKTVTTPQLRMEKLLPGTNYTVTISAENNDGEWSQSFVVTTLSSTGEPTLGFKDSEYDKDTPILLTLMNFTTTVKSVAWYIDGTATTDTYVKMAAGKHRVMAVITNGQDKKEYLIKYITVK